MAAWKVRASFHNSCHPLTVRCGGTVRIANASPTHIRCAPRPTRREQRVRCAVLPFADRPPIQMPLPQSPLKPASRASAMVAKGTAASGRPQYGLRGSGCSQPLSTCGHGAGAGRETGTRRVDSGLRRPVSGSLGRTSCKRQRGRPETRQSGGQSVPMDAAPRCRCFRRARRLQPIPRSEAQSPRGEGRRRPLQARGIPICQA
jgi:hypothetical protein